MPSAHLPEIDLRSVEKFCSDMWPEKFRDEVQTEFHVRGRSVTLCETRAPWDGHGEWTHGSFAQLRFRPEEGDWTLYWADRNSRWHEYHEGNIFNGTMAQLLAEIDDDPTSIFKG